LTFSCIAEGAALVLAVIVADSIEKCVFALFNVITQKGPHRLWPLRLMVFGISPGGMASGHSRRLVLQRQLHVEVCRLLAQPLQFGTVDLEDHAVFIQGVVSAGRVFDEIEELPGVIYCFQRQFLRTGPQSSLVVIG